MTFVLNSDGHRFASGYHPSFQWSVANESGVFLPSTLIEKETLYKERVGVPLEDELMNNHLVHILYL